MTEQLTRDHVVWAYRILLDRDPESEAVIAPKLQAYRTTRELRADMTTSEEYRLKNRDFAHTNESTIVIRELDRGGPRLFLDLADHAIGLNVLRSRYEQGALAFMKRVVRAGDVVVDGGAHIGFFTVHLATLVGEAGQVYAFEPMDENAALLERSVGENRFQGRVAVLRAALGRASSSARLVAARETLNTGGAYVLPEDAPVPDGHAGRPVLVRTLDEAVARRPVAFVKLDVEGAEPLALEGARDILQRDRPVVLAEMHSEQLARVSGYTPGRLAADMRGLGYHACWLEGDSPGEAIGDATGVQIGTAVYLPEGRWPMARVR